MWTGQGQTSAGRPWAWDGPTDTPDTLLMRAHLDEAEKAAVWPLFAKKGAARASLQNKKDSSLGHQQDTHRLCDGLLCPLLLSHLGYLLLFYAINLLSQSVGPSQVSHDISTVQ